MKRQAVPLILLTIGYCYWLNAPTEATFGKPDAPFTAIGSTITANPSAPACNSDSPFRIDIMVLYTTKAHQQAGGTDKIKAEIAKAVAQTNQAYFNSRIEQRLRLVHSAEISYQENPAFDLANLAPSSDTEPSHAALRKQIKDWRDKYYADCVVVIVDYEGQDGPEGLTEPNDAFSIVDRVPATKTFTFAHELGHQMGAGHECGNSEAARAGFAHGFVSKTKKWGTIMTTAANRIPYFSNPNVKYRNEALGCLNLHCNTTSPTLGQCQADNHRVLNQNALKIAHLRCGERSTKGVWLRETWNDFGEEPASNPAGEAPWNSPALWVRKQQDKMDATGSEYQHQYQHEKPAAYRDNWVYAMLHNDSPTTANGTLELFYATGATPGSAATWKKIQSVKVVNFAGFSTKVVEAKWEKGNIPRTGSYHLLARWVSPDDPAKTGQLGNFATYIRRDNNLVWRKIR
jgi:hypothetical protein